MSDVQSINPHRYEYDPESGVVYCKLDFMGFPEYRVGDDGSVWSCLEPVKLGYRYGSRSALSSRWLRLKPKQLKPGYLLATFAPGPRYKTVHRLVLEAFAGPCPEGMEACHSPDPTRTANHISNLRWGTHKSNMKDRDTHKHTCRGERHRSAKLTSQKVKDIRAEYATGVGYHLLSKKHEVSKNSIRCIVRRKTWKHVA